LRRSSFTTIGGLATMTIASTHFATPACFTAIVPAGRRPGPPDGLAAARGESFKAHVKVHGVPMLERVIRTLQACPDIGDIVILAQDQDGLLAGAGLGWLATESHVRFERSSDSISASVHALLANGRVRFPVLLTTADHALLTPDMIAHFIADSCAANADVTIAMVERKTLLAKYPGNQRTWLKFTDGWWSGANLFGLLSPKVLPALELWRSVEQDRKRGWKIIAAFGPWLLLRVVMKTLSLRDALALAGKRLGMKAALVAMPMAEACIDIDKESDLVLAEKILGARDAAG
jgi:GTP:adenosylcobinamide-phosphate guanylyltransferase